MINVALPFHVLKLAPRRLHQDRGKSVQVYSGTSEKGTLWDQYKIRVICPLYRGCPLLRGSNCIILIGRDKFGFVLCGEVFNTVSLSRRVLFERFHCISFNR